jgi:hypothetical protein
MLQVSEWRVHVQGSTNAFGGSRVAPSDAADGPACGIIDLWRVAGWIDYPSVALAIAASYCSYRSWWVLVVPSKASLDGQISIGGVALDLRG